jgi:hypothetical protein
MTMLPQQPAMFAWQQPLAALFGGLSAAGQPGGLANFGAGVNQTMQAQSQQAQQQQIAELRRMQIEQAQMEMNRANKEQADRDAAAQQVAAMFGGGQSQARPVGNYGAAVGGAPQPSMFGNLSPEQSALLQQRAKLDPMGTLDFVTQQAFAQPEGQEAASPIGKIMADLNAGLIDEATANALIKKETYIAPAAQGPDTWEQYIDPKSGRTGQRSTRTGKIDWDPGNTMMVQTGTDQNGNPIFDMVSTSAGRPPSEANIQAGIRGTLIEGAVDEIRKIASDAQADISPLRMAAADAISEKGPLGAYGANVMRTDDEKKYSASIAKGVEGLVAAITGAGVAMSQFPRIQQLIPGPTDGPEIVNWKLDQLVPVLDTMLAASGPLALTKKPGGAAAPAAPSGPAEIDGYKITPVD